MARESYIGFQLMDREPGKKTDKWVVYSTYTGEPLGEIVWYSAWRRYVYQTEKPLVMDAGCLEDIAEFLNAKMDKWRNSYSNNNKVMG